jgi:hypothetical protein
VAPKRAARPQLNRYISRDSSKNAQDMVYRYRVHPRRRVEYVTGAVEAITGCTPAELYADPDLIRKTVHPDDRQLLVPTKKVDPQLWKVPVTIRWVHRDGATVMGGASAGAGPGRCGTSHRR